MANAEVPPGFDPDAAVAWLPRQAELLAPTDATLQIDPKAAVEPAGIVLLASLIAARKAEGRETQVVGNEAVIGRLGSLEPVTDLKSARRQADAMDAILEAELPQAASSVLRAARFVFEELGANIVQHSGRPDTGFGALAAWPERGEGRFQIAFCDAGVGFLASLSRNPELASRVADDGDAIQLAVEKGLSGGEGRANMGMGLGLLLDLSDRLGADLRIVSGAVLWHRRTAARDHRVGTLRAVSRLQGAWICLDAPAFPR